MKVFRCNIGFGQKTRMGFIFVGMCQANNIFSHKKSAVHLSTVGLAI